MPSFVDLPYFYPLALVLLVGATGLAASIFELWRGSRPLPEPVAPRNVLLGGRR
jgi:hypothetical protein